MDGTVNPRESFGQYLEASGPGTRAEETRRLLGAETVATLRLRWNGRLLNNTVTPDEVRRALGVPDRETDTTLGYILPQRPGYLYTFVFDFSRGHHLAGSGFERIEPIAPMGADRRSDSLDEIVSSLMNSGSTMSEVRAQIGVPAKTYGWWPIETFEYTDGLELTFRHGILDQYSKSP